MRIASYGLEWSTYRLTIRCYSVGFRYTHSKVQELTCHLARPRHVCSENVGSKCRRGQGEVTRNINQTRNISVNVFTLRRRGEEREVGEEAEEVEEDITRILNENGMNERTATRM